MTYSAVVVPLSDKRAIVGADRIALFSAGPYSVIASIANNDGDVGVLFPPDGKLSDAMLAANDLVKRKDANGNAAGGFFEANGRVKAISMRGARSEGFWTPLSSLAWAGPLDALVPGTQFVSLNGHAICKKYETPATLAKTARVGNKRPSFLFGDAMPFVKHVDTGDLRRSLGTIPEGATLFISEKLHGTSHRIAHIHTWRPRNATLTRVAERITLIARRIDTLTKRISLSAGVERRVGQLTARALRAFDKKEWRIVHGTRNTTIAGEDGGFYGSHAFRIRAVGDGASRLRKGEIVMGEIVGYDDRQRPLFSHSTLALRDKRVTKRYGDEMVYRYGAPVGGSLFFVYRIAITNEDGDVQELTWEQMNARAVELGFRVVPHLATRYGYDPTDASSHDGGVGRVSLLGELSEDGAIGAGGDLRPSTLDASHIREGVVVRWEKGNSVGWLKHKTWLFGVLEGYKKDDADYVDAEESA